MYRLQQSSLGIAPNGVTVFMWKWNIWLLTAVNSPLNIINQPVRSETLNYTSTMNISPLEKNKCAPFTSFALLNDWDSSHNLFIYFNQSPCHLFHAIIVNDCTLHWNHYRLFSSWTSWTFLFFWLLFKVFMCCLMQKHSLNTTNTLSSFTKWMFDSKMPQNVHIHLWLILRCGWKKSFFSFTNRGSLHTCHHLCSVQAIFSLYSCPTISPFFYNLCFTIHLKRS